MKKLDFKTIVIIILGAALIISFFFGQKSNINKHEAELKALHIENTLLLTKNDSLIKVNSVLDGKIVEVNKQLEANVKQLSENTTQLEVLKKKKNEIPVYVNNLSANGVSSEFTNFLESTNTR